MKPKLLFVINTDSFFISHRLPIAMAALNKGFEVHLAANIKDHKSKIQSKGIYVHHLRLDRSSTDIFSNGLLFLDIFLTFRRVRPDIIHLVTIKPVLLGGLAARLMKRQRLVIAISGLGYIFLSQNLIGKLRKLIVGLLYRIALRHPVLKVIFQNESDERTISEFTNLPKGNTEIIRGSGVDLKKFSPSRVPTGKPIMLMAARLLSDKGVNEFVKAAEILKHKNVEARFVLVGEPDNGNPATISEKKLHGWVKSGVIEWWGQQRDMPKVMKSSYAIVLPSYREGLPKVLSEAAASQRAVITTDVPGCRDAILENVTGMLVPIRDPETLAIAMNYLIQNRDVCKNMGKEGRKLAENCFNVDDISLKHIRIYQELLKIKL